MKKYRRYRTSRRAGTAKPYVADVALAALFVATIVVVVFVFAK